MTTKPFFQDRNPGQTINADFLNDIADNIYGPTAAVGTLRSDLLLTMNGVIGFQSTLTGGVLRRLYDKMSDMVHIRDFGTLGGTDDAAIWQKAIDSGALTIDARGVVSNILTQVNGASNQTILLAGAQIATAGTTVKVFSYVSKTKFNLIGPAIITGDLVTNPGTGVTAVGVYVEDCSKFRVDGITVLNVKGYGFRYSPGGSATARYDHGVFANLRVDSCVWGWKDDPGTGSEYCTMLNFHVSQCAEAGIETAAGNLLWAGGHCVDNLKDGMRIFGGTNNAHGIVTGMNINHNVQYNIYTQDVTNGMTFTGCHTYANNSSGAGALYFKNSKGIVMDGGTRDCWVYNDSGANSGQNYLLDQYCPGDYGDSKLLSTNSALRQLVQLRCFGPGAYMAAVSTNTPSKVFLAVSRAALAYQTLTTAVATTLNFPTTNSDRRETYSATSIFTVPAGEAGWYKISGNNYFTGTTLNAAACSIELQKNGAAFEGYYPSSLFGAGTVGFCYDSDGIYLAVGDTLKLVATITGTGTIQHGHPTYRCSMNVERTDGR